MNDTGKKDTAAARGAEIPAGKGAGKAVLNFLATAIERGLIDSVLVPMRTPQGDSYAWILVSDADLLAKANPLPPVMTVQGGRALSRLTRYGKPAGKVAAVMRPCEVEAAIELSKLEQVDLENILLVSIDCPGAMPLAEYVSAPDETEDAFAESLEDWNTERVRPVCRVCDRFSMPGSDLHVGTIGAEDGNALLIPGSEAGEGLLAELGIAVDKVLDVRLVRVSELAGKRTSKKAKAHEEIRSRAEGLDGLLGVLENCVDCHNCMRVCPICYCRQCYSDSEIHKAPVADLFSRAEKKGRMALPHDTLLFHLVRMAHMTPSCVSCGMCQDACPAGVPIAELFSMVAERNQAAFDYVPGRDAHEPLPLARFKKKELEDIEQLCVHGAGQE